MRPILILAAAALVFAGIEASPAKAQPRVAASFPAIQSIAAGVMAGIAAPETLAKGGASPHVYALRPSEARLLEAADLVIWVGPVFETPMARAIGALGAKTRQIVWADLPGVVLLAAREGGPWEGHSHAPGHSHSDSKNDGHLFLDPRNAIVLATAIAATLADIDPGNAQRYRDNAARVVANLQALDRTLDGVLRPLGGKPFIVFHDALQYLEARYGLTPAGSITVSPERRPGAQRLQRIRERVRRTQAICVFAEPQFEPALVATIVEGTSARVASIDYVGVGIAPGPDAYAAIMTKLANDLATCLKGS
jgi:zinc transport system substrate-binding protein